MLIVAKTIVVLRAIVVANVLSVRIEHIGIPLELTVIVELSVIVALASHPDSNSTT